MHLESMNEYERFDSPETKEKNKKIVKVAIIVTVICVVLISLTLGLYFGLRKSKDKYDVVNRNVELLQQWNFYQNLTQLAPDFETIDFSKPLENTVQVNVPHTWNNLDGQNGSVYAQIPSAYQTYLNVKDPNKQIYVEFCGANLKTTVYLDGKKIGKHMGGYSKFRFDLTNYVSYDTQTKNLLTVVVDNSNNREYYPQSADYTFFGGLYRNVHIISVDKTAFNLSDYGSSGLYVLPNPQTGEVSINVSFTRENESIKPKVRYTITDNKKTVYEYISDEIDGNSHTVNTTIKKPHLWNGRDDPHLYHLSANLIVGKTILDTVETNFGFRTIEINKTGCFLNGRKYQLRGVSRHQDRLDKGWAISNEDEEEDFNLIYELGANVVRLSHYPQNATAYDICDRLGIIILNEIPFVSDFLNTTSSGDNLIDQLSEMVKQNYNHPCVGMWGIMNEVGMSGNSQSLFDFIHVLNAKAKSLDPSRLTYSAMIMTTSPSNEMNQITDVIGYNLYGGWYFGNNTFNAWMIDSVRNVSANKPLSLTEYGAEAVIQYHSDTPVKHDYTEEYQVLFHKEAYEMIEEKDLWGSFVWNMFDFASAQRNEGGVKGRNNKGLVTYDRKTKKDSFYYYKAVLNTVDQFVHICGHRFHDRATDSINVSVITSKTLMGKTLTLYLNNKKVGQIENNNNIINVFNVPLQKGKNNLKAVINNNKKEIADQAEFEKVDVPNPDYIWYNESAVEDLYPHPEGYYSILDTFGAIHDSPIIWDFLQVFAQDYIDVDEYYPYLQCDRLIDLMSTVGAFLPDGTLQAINAALNQIPKLEFFFTENFSDFFFCKTIMNSNNNIFIYINNKVSLNKNKIF